MLEAAAPALVLGSTQGDDVVDGEAAAAGASAVVRRRSGGGVVLVEPATTAWVDVIVPAGDPLWDDDVGRAARWVGRAWQAALADLGVAPTEVHEGALACGPLGPAGLLRDGGGGRGDHAGPAQVGGRQPAAHPGRGPFPVRRLLGSGGRHPLVDLLRLDAEGARAVDGAAAGVGRPPAAIVDAFLRHLPR